MADTVRFASAFSKIERSEKHIVELETAFSEYLATDFAGPVIEKDPTTGALRLAVRIKIPLPEAIPLALGDAVHALSSALDHVMHQLVPMHTFPTHEKREALEASFAAADPNTSKRAGGNNAIQKAFPELFDLIVNTIRPYDTGDGADERGRAVWALRKLDNIDKHRMIIPVLNVSEISNFSASDDIENRILSDTTVRFESGLSLTQCGPGMKITNEGRATGDILFPKGTYFTGDPVIPTLGQLQEFTLGVVETFEARFKGR